MKKLLIAILAAGLASGAFAQTFPDIPEGHWAGDAVERIADLNIVIGFPDGTFRGNEAFTRYQAALVISRMLDVVNANMDAALAMTDEDIASLRNAVQELAADVAAQGVRLSAAEGAIAGLSDDTAANTASIAELEAMIEGMDLTAEIDPAVLRDLQNQIASQRVATDTAQATADAAQATADAAQSRANSALSTAQANASEIAALNELVQILGDQIEALQGMGTDTTGLATNEDLAALEGDIANIREFVILLRRDQVALRDRVSGLEASDEQQTTDIADLQARVTELEENPLGISGTIDLEYFVGRADGALAEFDIDRAYGVGMMRDIGESVFSSGTDDEANPAGEDDEVDEPGEYAEDRADIEYGSEFDADITINLGMSSVFDGEGSPRGLNSFEAVLTLSLEETDFVVVDDDDDISGADATGYVWFVDEFTATFDPIGAAPLTFAFGEEVTGSFTPYTLNLEDVGFVASVGSPDFLSFLDPSLQVAYLTDAVDDGYVATGIRGTLSPIDGVTGGFSFVKNADNTGDKDDWQANNVTDTVWGLDATANLELGTLGLDLAGEYASGSTYDAATDTTTDATNALFVTLDTEIGILGGIDLAANYRDIDVDWDNDFGAQLDDDDYPYEVDQSGFGVNAGLGLFIFDIGVYFDSYSIDSGLETSAFGVDATANLFRGFSVSGFYDQVSVDGNVVNDNEGDDPIDAGAPDTERDDAYRTGFGVGLAHDGASDNALIANLNLEFAYERFDEDFDDTRIYAAADYTLNVSILELTPYVSYESEQDEDAGTDDTVELMVGTGLSTQPLDVIFQPSLEAAVNYRTNEHTDLDAYTAEQLQWAVGLNLGEFLLPYSSLTARYGSYTGTNITGDVFAGDPGTDISEGDENTGLTTSVSGYEVEWNYYDLMISYGVYTHDADVDNAGGETAAQAFGVSYSVAF